MRVVIYSKYLMFVLGAVGLLACSREEEMDDLPSNQTIQVKALMQPASNASSTAWNESDAFGLYVKPSASSDFTALLESNRKFTYSATNSSFELAGNPIYYPQSGEVDLIGYAPYKQGISHTYSVDVTNQVDLNAIDLLYSNNAKSMAKSSTAVPLNLTHQLSKISFNILSSGPNINLGSARIDLKGFYDKAEFNLATGVLSNPVVSAPSIALGTSREGIVIPNTGLTSRSIEFTIDNMTWKYVLPDSEIFEAGNHYEYTITIVDHTVIIELSNIVSWTNNGGLYNTEPADALPLEYVYIPAGSFQMGAPDTSTNAGPYVRPQHWVKISKGFHMSKHEITIAQYAEFLNALGVDGSGSTEHSIISHTINGENIFLFSIDRDITLLYVNNSWSAPVGRENYPMCNVSWDGALAYANWQGGTLPSEAQWEYAYRAGTKTYFFYGGALSEEFRPYANFYNGNIWTTAALLPVGQKLANPWGLKDMAGNIREWTLDLLSTGIGYRANTEQTPEIDPVVTTSSVSDQSLVPVRGGDYYSSGSYASSYYRAFTTKRTMNKFLGFRIVINP